LGGLQVASSDCHADLRRQPILSAQVDIVLWQIHCPDHNYSPCHFEVRCSHREIPFDHSEISRFARNDTTAELLPRIYRQLERTRLTPDDKIVGLSSPSTLKRADSSVL